jgi:hypothetical protein
MRIEGYMLIMVTDTVFPTLLSVANNMIDKKHKVTVSDLKLSEEDMSALSPLADQAASSMSIALSPIAGYFIMSAFMYANTMINVKMGLSK